MVAQSLGYVGGSECGWQISILRPASTQGEGGVTDFVHVGVDIKMWVSPTLHVLCPFKTPPRPPPQAVAGGFLW